MILAQGTDIVSSLLGLGPIGVVAAALIVAIIALWRQIRTNAEADRKARDAAEEKLRQSHADMIDKVMPVLQNVQSALVAAVEAMRDDRRDRR